MLNGCTKSKEFLFLCEIVYRKLGHCNCHAYMVLCSCCGFHYKVIITKWSVLSFSSLINMKLNNIQKYFIDVQKNLDLILLWILWLFPSLFGILSGIFLIFAVISVSEIKSITLHQIFFFFLNLILNYQEKHQYYNIHLNLSFVTLFVHTIIIISFITIMRHYFYLLIVVPGKYISCFIFQKKNAFIEF